MSEFSPGTSLSGSGNGNALPQASIERLKATSGSLSSRKQDSRVRTALASGLRGEGRPIRKVGFAPIVEYAPDPIELSSLKRPRRPDSPIKLSDAPAPEPEPSGDSIAVVDEPQLRKRRVARARDSIDGAPSVSLPPVPLIAQRDAILSLLASKRWEVRAAELRHRVAAGGGTVSLYSTIGMAMAVAIEVPLAILVKTIPLGVLIALPPFIWGFAAIWGALIEFGRVRHGTASISVDRASARAVSVNLCRLITDLDNIKERSPTRKLLLEEALRTLGDTTGLINIYAGRGYMYQIGTSMLLGPFYLLLHLMMARRVHKGASLAEAIWLFGGDDEERRYVHMLSEGREPWSDFNLEAAGAALVEVDEEANDYVEPEEGDGAQETDQLSPPARGRMDHAVV